jgi:DNA-binding transcriptional ArsR family regulator
VFDGQLNRVFRALANTNSRWIIEHLSETDLSVTELAEAFAISFRGVLDHIEILERCGLVRTLKAGQVRNCSLDPDTLLAAEHWMRRTLWRSRRDRLGSLPQDWRFTQRPERPEGMKPDQR